MISRTTTRTGPTTMNDRFAKLFERCGEQLLCTRSKVEESYHISVCFLVRGMEDMSQFTFSYSSRRQRDEAWRLMEPDNTACMVEAAIHTMYQSDVQLAFPIYDERERDPIQNSLTNFFQPLWPEDDSDPDEPVW